MSCLRESDIEKCLVRKIKEKGGFAIKFVVLVYLVFQIVYFFSQKGSLLL